MPNPSAVSRSAAVPLATVGEPSRPLRADRADAHALAAPDLLSPRTAHKGHAGALPGPRNPALLLAPIDGTVLSNEPQRRKEAAGAVVTLDLEAVRHNFRNERLKQGKGEPITVDGYGLGVCMAKVLVEEGCRTFVVARATEAMDLRKALRDELPGLAGEVAVDVLVGRKLPAPVPGLGLKSKIAQVRELSPPDAVGYGQKYVARQPMRVATIPIGYADGMPRIGGGNRPGDAPVNPYVLVNGKHKAPLVGATSMDLTTIDVSDVPAGALQAGTPVTVIGDGITPGELGRMYGIDAAEVPAKLAGRVHLEVHDKAHRAAAGSGQASAHVMPSRRVWGGGPARAAATPASPRRQAIENLRAGRLAKDAASAVATLDLGAVRRNFRTGLQRLGQDVTPAAVIKADGYGLGAVRLAKVLIEEGCRDFFVARISEGVDLRQALRAELPELADKVAINVLDGNLPGSDPQWLVEHRLTPVLNSLEQVRQWNEAGRAQKRQLPAILQVDTGLNRSGMPGAELQALLADRERHLGHVKLQFIMTHLANAGEVTRGDDGTPQPGDVTRRQLARFDKIREHFPGIKASIGASSTVYLDKSLHKDMVRMGGIFHGQAPFDADSNPLEPVLALETKIAHVRELSRVAAAAHGLGVGTDRPVKVAKVPIGWADGLSGVAGAASGAYMLVDGKYKAPLVGGVRRDEATIDVSALPPGVLKAGTKVTVIGHGITTDHLGLMYDTNASETQTKLARRVHKVIVDEASPPAADSRRFSANVWSRLNP